MYKRLLYQPGALEFKRLQELQGHEFEGLYGYRPSEMPSVFIRDDLFGALHKRFDQDGLRKLANIKGGCNSYIFLSTHHQVVKILKRHHASKYKGEPEIIDPLIRFQPFYEGDKGDAAIGFEVYPEFIPLVKLLDHKLAGDLAINHQQAGQICMMLYRRLMARNINFYEPEIENTCIMIDGTPAVMDTGDVHRIRHPQFTDNRELVEENRYGLQWDGTFIGKQQKHVQKLGLSYGHIRGLIRRPREGEKLNDKWADYIASGKYAAEIAQR